MKFAHKSEKVTLFLNTRAGRLHPTFKTCSNFSDAFCVTCVCTV